MESTQRAGLQRDCELTKVLDGFGADATRFVWEDG